jgi:hypothetical protein
VVELVTVSFYHRSTVEDLEALAESEFAVIARTSLQAYPKKFKLFVAYLEGLVAVAQYRSGTAYPHAAGYTEEVAGEAFESLNMAKK